MKQQSINLSARTNPPNMAKTIRRAQKHQQRQTFAKPLTNCKIKQHDIDERYSPSERSARSRSPKPRQTKRRNTHEIHERRSTSSMSCEPPHEQRNNKIPHGKRPSPYDEPAIQRDKIRRGSNEQTQKRSTPIGRPIALSDKNDKADKTRHEKSIDRNEQKPMSSKLPPTRRWAAPRYDGPLAHMKSQFRCAELRAQRNLMADVNKAEYRTLFDRYVVEFKAGRNELSEGAMNGVNGHAHKRALFDYIALWLGTDAFEFKKF